MFREKQDVLVTTCMDGNVQRRDGETWLVGNTQLKCHRIGSAMVIDASGKKLFFTKSNEKIVYYLRLPNSTHCNGDSG